jgi:hypothetical protein
MVKNATPERLRTRGAASIEFTMVFIIFFLLFYGLVGYTLPILLSSSYQEIASEGLREAVDLYFVPAEGNGAEEINIPGYVQQLVERSWLPSEWQETCPGYAEGFLDRQDGVWRVCLRYSDPESIIPPFRIFGWSIPALPDEIRGEAVIRIY